MITRTLLLLTLSLGLSLATMTHAQAGQCRGQLGLQSVSQVCHYSGGEVRQMYREAGDDDYTYKLDPRCKPGNGNENCQVFASCTTADGAEGTIYII